MYKVNLNDTIHQIDLNPDQKTGIIDGKEFVLDIEKTSDGYHILRDGKSYVVQIIEVDRKSKEVKLKINGHVLETKSEDSFDALLKSLGMEIGASKKLKDIKAPMPGLVLDIQVKAGDSVNEKDPVLILEAMKMENVIKSPIVGIIKKVHIEKGKTVEKNQILLEFE